MEPNETPQSTPLESNDVASSTSYDALTTPVVATGVSGGLVIGSKKKRHFRGPILALVVVLLLVGGGVFAWSQRANSSTPAVTETIQSIPNIRVGSTKGPIGSDNVFPAATHAPTSLAIDLQVYEGLVGYKDKKIVPLLATSWTNPNKNTWVFQIAKNVTFQNGQPMTATDVKNSLVANLQNDSWKTYLSTVSSVKVTGNNELTITTAQPDSLLLNRLVYSFIFKANGSTTVGTGPYVIDTAKPLTDSATSLEAYAGYHGGTPLTKSITYAIYDSSEALAKAFQANKIDTFEDTTNSKLLATLQQNGTTAFSYNHPGANGLRLNTVHSGAVLANPKLREAVAYAFDRADLVKKLSDTTVPTQTIVPKTVVGYDATATFPGLDIAKAKQLQTDAGYPNGAPLTYLYVQDLQPDAPILISQLTAAGFKVTPHVAATPAEAEAAARVGSFDLFESSNYTDYNDASDIFASVLDSTQSSIPAYNNPAFDAIIAAAAQEFDSAAHAQKVQDINKFVAKNYLWIPLYNTSSTVYSAPGYQVTQNFDPTTNTVYFWHVGKIVRA